MVFCCTGDGRMDADMDGVTHGRVVSGTRERREVVSPISKENPTLKIRDSSPIKYCYKL